MKKLLIVASIVMAIFLMGSAKAEEVLIPQEAIRLRVIPNSNEEEDQALKIEVRNQVQKEIARLLKNVTSVE